MEEVLRKYDRLGFKDPKQVKAMLWADYNIEMRYLPYIFTNIYISLTLHSEWTISRQQQQFNLTSSSQTMAELPENVKRQFVLDALSKDPMNQKGPPLIKEDIRLATGFDLTR